MIGSAVRCLGPISSPLQILLGRPKRAVVAVVVPQGSLFVGETKSRQHKCDRSCDSQLSTPPSFHGRQNRYSPLVILEQELRITVAVVAAPIINLCCTYSTKWNSRIARPITVTVSNSGGTK